jgi:cobalt-zinc-cadmium efflux system outer membrane protein
MQPSTTLRVAIVACVLAFGGRAARSDERGPRPVTLEAARDAVGHAPRQRTAIARTTAAAEAIPAAGGWPATSFGVFTNYRTARLGLLASLPLPVFGTARARTASVAIARAERDVATAGATVVELELRRDITRAWLELARAEARAAASATSAQRQAALSEIARQRFDAGDVSHADAVQTDAAARRARARASADATAIGSASAELAALLGWDPDQRLHADGALPSPASIPSLAELRQRRAAHPSARAATAQLAVETTRIAEAQAGRWPSVSLDTEAAFDDPTLPGTDLRVGLTLSLPLLGRHGAAERAAVARSHVAQLEHDATVSALDGAIVAAYRRFEAARDNATALASDVVPAQRQAAELAREAYTEGAGGLASVLEAERALAEAEVEASDARVDAAIAHAELTWAVGHEP